MSAFYADPAERAAAMKARPAVRKLAAALAVTIEERLEDPWHELRLTAPDGHVFDADGLHEWIVANAAATTDGLWTRALERLAATGVEACPEGEACEWCHS